MGVPQQLDGLFHGKSHRSKWMRTGGNFRKPPYTIYHLEHVSGIGDVPGVKCKTDSHESFFMRRPWNINEYNHSTKNIYMHVQNIETHCSTRSINADHLLQKYDVSHQIGVIT